MPRSARSARSAIARSGRRLAAVVAPPYDVIAPEGTAACWPVTRATSSASTCPADEPGDEPDERYRRAARTLAAWRSDGTLRKDPRSAIYVYEQTYRVPGTDDERTQRGFFAASAARAVRARSGVLPPRADARRAARGPLPAAAGDGVNTQPGRRRCTTTASGDEPQRVLATARPRPRRRRGGRRRRCPPPAVGRRPPTGEAEARVAALVARARAPAPWSRSPTATTATRRRCATATSGG